MTKQSAIASGGTALVVRKVSVAPGSAPVRIEIPHARSFIEKSLSEDTCRVYTRTLLDFFAFVKNRLPRSRSKR